MVSCRQAVIVAGPLLLIVLCVTTASQGIAGRLALRRQQVLLAALSYGTDPALAGMNWLDLRNLAGCINAWAALELTLVM